MSDPEWRANCTRDQARLSEARLQAHYAAQWLARVARGYIPPQFDDGHTNLGWDRAVAGLLAHALPDGTRVALTVADLCLVLLDAAGAKQATLSLDGRTDADVRAWLGDRLSAKQLDPAALDAVSPYAMPRHALADGAAYAP